MTLYRHYGRLVAVAAAVAGLTLDLAAVALPLSSPAYAQVQMANAPATAQRESDSSVTCNTPVTSAPTGRATVSTRLTAYGTVLVVGGSGPKAGCSLYVLTSDPVHAHPSASFACPDTPVPALADPPGSTPPTCANDLWPALLTKGAPIAGSGVDRHLLKTVARDDVIPGSVVQQVTYAGQPLYFFFMDEAPGETDGANLFDNVVDPTGVWYLVGRDGGRVAPGTADLQVEDSSSNGGTGPSQTVLAAMMNDGFQVFPNALFPVYTFSGDSGEASACTGKCAVYWPPVLTSRPPVAGAGVDSSGLGTIMRADGTWQVTYNGKPLYLFVGDAYIAPLPSPFNGPGGVQGDGVTAFGGTFNAIPLP